MPHFLSSPKLSSLNTLLSKTLLSICGGSANKTAFASMASQLTSRKSFIDSSINLERFQRLLLQLPWRLILLHHSPSVAAGVPHRITHCNGGLIESTSLRWRQSE
ncbi:hypothetical protein RHSIM_Rhsim01G0046900 [Rhododendron simsii]|uniref:Uncharacterized protein n=1 Tax=Rhododendron simsii TaxID=118357 RepID=A0A834LWD7_RHOSS|nr:hypothetical protein RHSIM_Rhsim01G0046900 [Rhododendron simsii]